MTELSSVIIPTRQKAKRCWKIKGDSAFVLSREPLFEKISSSGDIGYTYGIHTNTNKITGEITKGTYITIWQKQIDGSWKFILDTGNQGLSESSE
jgi:ketosteroid isomerase-like protein